MRWAIFLGIAAVVAAQQQSYSSHPGAPPPKSQQASKHVKNAIDYTPDGDFLRRAAEDNAFIIECALWARDGAGSGAVRGIATELIVQELKLGDDLRKLAGRKHVVIADRINDRDAGERSRIANMHSADTDSTFVNQVLRRYDQEMVAFQKEADSVADPDIRSFAADGVGTLGKHRKLVETLQGKVK